MKALLALSYCLLMRLTFAVRGTAVVNKCWLIAFVWCGVVEADPSYIKITSAPARNMVSEVLNCSLEDGEFWNKEFLHGMWPIRNDWVYAAEFGMKSSLEFSASGGLASFVTTSPREMSNNSRHDKSASDASNVVHNEIKHVGISRGLFLGLIMGIFIMFCGFRDPWGWAKKPFQKPNICILGMRLIIPAVFSKFPSQHSDVK